MEKLFTQVEIEGMELDEYLHSQALRIDKKIKLDEKRRQRRQHKDKIRYEKELDLYLEKQSKRLNDNLC